jgi:putative membrane protein
LVNDSGYTARVGVRFLDDAARAAFKRAIETIENASAVEVVVAVRRRSAAYRHANVAIGTAAAFAGLAAMLFAAHPFALGSILVDPFVVGLLAGLATELSHHAKRWLTTPATRRHAVARAARATFVERGVHTTTGRSGILVYISWLEGEVALVADVGLARALPEGALARAENELTRAMRQGGTACANRLEALADAMATAMPHRADDVNELPDAIDEAAT